MSNKTFITTFKEVYFKTFDPYIDFSEEMEQLEATDPTDYELVKEKLHSIFKKALHSIIRKQDDIPSLFLLDFVQFYGGKVRRYSDVHVDDELKAASHDIKTSVGVGHKIRSSIRYYYRVLDLVFDKGINPEFLVENGVFLDNQVLKYSVKVNEQVEL